jgi:anti-sigma factor RsiW
MRTRDEISTEVVIHMAVHLEPYAAGKLDPSLAAELEAHLVLCDACFAAYVALLVKSSS